MNETYLTPLLNDYAAAPSPAVMAKLVEGYLPLSRAIARKFSGRGVEQEDLEQVAAMALMKAIERFEPQRGLKFSTFAMPTIAGEVRNYLRDKGSMLRMSRDNRTLLFRLQKTRDELTQRLQREPSIRELARAMELSDDDLLAMLDARAASEVVSMDSAVGDEADGASLGDFLGETERGYERVEDRAWLEWVFSQVTPTERRLLELRYIHRMGQRETAAHLGVSQMQVSRMERRILARLRQSEENRQERS